MKKSPTSRGKSVPDDLQRLLETLKVRFEENPRRHPALEWDEVMARLDLSPGALKSLSEMERTEGEPDVVGVERGAFLFVDCAPESPSGRRSVCYDREALESRKDHPPKTSALDLAASMGIELLTEAHYGMLQTLGEFDTRTSSWIATPADIRKQGGALYAEVRYGRLFIGHNGAQSYYAGRGFRGLLRV
ncbi:MAG: DUF4256 domain-containing protein [Verrucomicrobiota bacterium]